MMRLFNRSQKFEISKRKFNKIDNRLSEKFKNEDRYSSAFWKKKDKTFICQILLLDGTDIKLTINKRAYGEDLMEKVFLHLDLIEKDYFGLQFMDHLQVSHWLDPTKLVKKQVKIGPPYTLSFRVKFYSSEPNNLREELTRYQFFLQLKREILTGKLPCPYETSVELSAYALQSELGDYSEDIHTPSFISEFRFVPDQTEHMELDIIEAYKQKKNQTPAQSETNYLNKVKWLDLYGVDFHTVLGKDGFEYSLGLTPSGVLVFERKQKIGLFFWPKINRFDFRNKKLILVVEEDEYMSEDENNDNQNYENDQPVMVKKEHTFVFRTHNYKAAKHLWKCAVQYHCFFRLLHTTQNAEPGKTSHHTYQKISQVNDNNFFRMGSRFRYSGKTEFQATFQNKARRSVQIERKPSQRYSRRPNVKSSAPNSSTPGARTVLSPVTSNANNSPAIIKDNILSNEDCSFSVLSSSPKLLKMSPIKNTENSLLINKPIETKQNFALNTSNDDNKDTSVSMLKISREKMATTKIEKKGDRIGGDTIEIIERKNKINYSQPKENFFESTAIAREIITDKTEKPRLTLTTDDKKEKVMFADLKYAKIEPEEDIYISMLPSSPASKKKDSNQSSMDSNLISRLTTKPLFASDKDDESQNKVPASLSSSSRDKLINSPLPEIKGIATTNTITNNNKNSLLGITTRLDAKKSSQTGERDCLLENEDKTDTSLGHDLIRITCSPRNTKRLLDDYDCLSGKSNGQAFETTNGPTTPDEEKEINPSSLPMNWELHGSPRSGQLKYSSPIMRRNESNSSLHRNKNVRFNPEIVTIARPASSLYSSLSGEDSCSNNRVNQIDNSENSEDSPVDDETNETISLPKPQKTLTTESIEFNAPREHSTNLIDNTADHAKLLNGHHIASNNNNNAVNRKILMITDI
ncbi:protein 4.1-like isoform X1 [Gordionus sp. m RMFG-2023]|uniref:protein 4.1-like isoform X1 n=1 Tax=Gordionus sp. m RMFG-2023 TaxID=3053472 RepID=UPI0031FBD3A0